MRQFLIVVTLMVTIFAEEIEIPQELKPIEDQIYQRLLTPEDGEVQRDIKSLFAQYILLTAMDAANNTSNSVPTPPQPQKTMSMHSQSLSQASAGVAQQQTPQVIYVYVTQPPIPIPTTERARDDVKTKKTKPTKPPKTKKPKPPKAPHPDRVDVEAWNKQMQQQQVALQQQLQQLQQQQQIQQLQQQQLQQSINKQPETISGSEPEPQEDTAPIVGPITVTHAPTVPSLVQSQAASTQVPILVPTATPISGAGPVTILTPAPTHLPAIPTLPITLRPRPSTEHVLNQVDKILINVAKGNVTGIVDQSLQINSSKPVQNLVTGILNTIFCTPINRLFGRCRGYRKFY